MKFLVDMPLSPSLAAWLTREGHDAVHAIQVGLERASDAQILDRAQVEHRLVITADLDYPRLLALTRAVGPGLILLRGGNFAEAEAITLLTRAFRAIASEELMKSIVVIERTRIRRRALPIEPGS